MTPNGVSKHVSTVLIALVLTGATAAPEKRQATATASVWQYQGCWSDDVNSRTLPVMADAGNEISNDRCQARCSELGYQLAGTEYSGECFCGNQVNEGAKKLPASSCNMACTHDASQVCGGANALNLYWDGTDSSPTPPADEASSAESSIIDSTTSSSLSDSGAGILLPTAASPTSVSSNKSTPSFDPVPLPTDETSSIVESSTTPTSASIPPTTLTAVPSDAVSQSPATTIPSGSTPIPAPTVVTTNLPNNFTYQGCFVDSQVARILAHQESDSSTLTVKGCINTCSSLGYGIAGVEWQVQCFCGDSILNGGYRATSPLARLRCRMACSGDATQGCGGSRLMAVYSNGNLDL